MLGKTSKKRVDEKPFLLFPIVLLTCGAGERELVSYICVYRNDEHTAEKMIADFKEDWGKPMN